MKYLLHARQQAQELREGLSEGDEEYLKADLERLGEDGWWEWAYRNRAEASEYLAATPAARARTKRWRERGLKLRLLLCAYQQARLGAWLITLSAAGQPGGGYRETTAGAGRAALKLLEQPYWSWPFYEPEPPFGWPGPDLAPLP